MARKIIQSIFRFLFWLLTDVQVSGLENVPQEGGCILSPNHLGVLEVPLIFVLVDKNNSTALVAKKHQKNLFISWLVKELRGIWLNRDEADSQAIRAAQKHLGSGGLLGLAPEGTRSKTGALMRAKTGAAYLADKTGVSVIPIAITGTEAGLWPLLRLRRPKITIRFGEPFRLPPIDRRNRDESLRRNTDEIMARIAAMLPPSYRGVYADHPRVKELLFEGQSLLQGEQVSSET